MQIIPRTPNPEIRHEVSRPRLPFRVFLGQTWEELVRHMLCRKPIPGGKFRWRNPARWWGTGLNRRPMEVDVVAESPDGRALLLGEVKLALTKAEAEHELSELRKKAELLPFASNYKRIEPRLFVAEGGNPDYIDLSWCEEN